MINPSIDILSKKIKYIKKVKKLMIASLWYLLSKIIISSSDCPLISFDMASGSIIRINSKPSILQEIPPQPAKSNISKLISNMSSSVSKSIKEFFSCLPLIIYGSSISISCASLAIHPSKKSKGFLKTNLCQAIWVQLLTF